MGEAVTMLVAEDRADHPGIRSRTANARARSGVIRIATAPDTG